MAKKDKGSVKVDGLRDGSAFEIIDNFELTPHERKLRGSKYPIANLKMNQGFLVPGATKAGMFYSIATKAGVKVSCSITPKGVQIKRVG